MNKYSHRHQFRYSEKQRPRQDSIQERFIGSILWRMEVKAQGRQAVFRQWCNSATIKGEGKEGGLVGIVRLLCQSKKVWTTLIGPLEESPLWQEWAHTFLVSHWPGKTQGHVASAGTWLWIPKDSWGSHSPCSPAEGQGSAVLAAAHRVHICY